MFFRKQNDRCCGLCIYAHISDEDTVVFANGKTTVNAYYAYKPTNLMEYRIVIAEDATEYEQYAAEEFHNKTSFPAAKIQPL